MSVPRRLRRVRRPLHRVASAFTLVELGVVMLILCILLAILLPALSQARKKAAMSKLSPDAPAAAAVGSESVARQTAADATGRAVPIIPAAHVKSFDADISLTPTLSVGTPDPESIYEVRFAAKMDVKPATEVSGDGPAGEHEVVLPLPPLIISLADLKVTMNGEPSDAVAIRGDQLVWRGRVDPIGPAALDVTYTAVGKGLYVLQTPPGKIIDTFRIGLKAHGSDVRMLELSLQPTRLSHAAGTTTYTWDYTRLMFGRPIALDVLGVAPLDRLGELRWLGPLSVLVLGILVGLFANAFDVAGFDRWLLLLVLGTFAGAYPLMYFAQEFIPLNWAMLISGGVVLLIIAVRTVTVMGFGRAIFGVVLPAAAIMGLTLTAAIRPQLQGILLTSLALGMFTVAMLLAPRMRLGSSRSPSAGPPAPPMEPAIG